VLVYHLVAAIYTMSITLALSRMLGVEGTERRVRGAVAADGLGSAIAALIGGVPLISYDQNVGAVSLTGVGSRFVVAAAGAILVLMALVPKVGALIAIVPPFVLGGTLEPLTGNTGGNSASHKPVHETAMDSRHGEGEPRPRVLSSSCSP
jgi:xanthine/uracil permease